MTQVAKRVLRDSDEAAIVPSVPVQKVQTKYTTAMAVQHPRELPLVEARSLEEAALLGEDGFYQWGQGKDQIVGPSKELAMALVRGYGNCAVDLGEVQETRDAWIFTATFVDLETGFTLARQFRQSKSWTVYGKFDEARKEDIRFQIGQSKAVRNVILNALPGWLVRRALDKCKGGVRKAIEDAIAKVGMEKFAAVAVDRLVKVGAKTENVLHAMGRKNVASLTLEDFVILSGARAAIESGQDTVEDLFPEPARQVEEKPAGNKAEDLAAKLGGEQVGATVEQVVAKVEERREQAKEAAAEASGDPLAGAAPNQPEPPAGTLPGMDPAPKGARKR